MQSNVIALSSIDLKQAYRKNMTIGFGISASLLLMAVLIIYGIMTHNYQKPIEIPKIIIDKPIDLIQPPSLSQQKEQIKLKIQEHKIKPSIGILVPVPDDQVLEGPNFATQEELAKMVPENPKIDFGSSGATIDVDKIMNEVLPKRGEFKSFEDAPVKVTDIMPIYPPMAQRAGVEGDVWLDVLIDKDGSVRDVAIAKASGANAGFEEAAIDAAKQTVWSPAIANGHPVAVWITYRIVSN